MIPAALLVDFDGTIVDTEWVIYQSWERTYLREGHELAVETYVQCIGSGTDFLHWSPKTHLEELTQKVFGWDEMDRVRNVEIRKNLARQGPRPGMAELLADLATAELCPLAVVSSSSHDWVDAWLDRLDLRKHFQAVVARGDAPRTKPAPDLFLEGARQLGLAPADCLVIEDSANGLAAATASGMKTFVTPNRVTQVSDFSEAEAVCDTADELRSALEAKFCCKIPRQCE